jgi:RimJ/RimL family protein N-acetyltransferase
MPNMGRWRPIPVRAGVGREGRLPEEGGRDHGSDMTENCSVALAPITEHDYQTFSQWSSSSSWVFATGAPTYLTPEQARAFIASVNDTFLMVRTADGRTIGAVSWGTLNVPGNFSVGIIIGDEEKWGAGFGVEATLLIMRFLFDFKNAHRVEFKCGTFNTNAIEYLCSGIIRIEGVLRDYYFLDGRYQDAIIGSILRDEFYALVPAERMVSDEAQERADKILNEYLEKNPITLNGR